MKKFILIFLLVLTNSLFSQVQLGLGLDGEAAGDEYGRSVSLSANGTIVAIGSDLNNGGGTLAGHVRVHQYSNGSWAQLGGDIDGESAFDQSGYAVSLSDNGLTLAIGAPWNAGGGTFRGHTRVYQYSAGSWSQVGADIDGEANDDYSGSSVSLSDDGLSLAIGATGNDGNGSLSGHVRVYKYLSGSWSQVGADIDGEAAGDGFGTSLALENNGTTLAVGASQNDGNGSNSGHVRVYNFSNGSWSQVGGDIDGEFAGDNSGASVSLSDNGNIVAIGAPHNYGDSIIGQWFDYQGHARIYEYSNNSWTQMGSDIDGTTSYEWSGHSVSLSNNGYTVGIGAYMGGSNSTPLANAGYVKLYDFDNSNWSQKHSAIWGENSDDRSGMAVSLSEIWASGNRSKTPSDSSTRELRSGISNSSTCHVASSKIPTGLPFPGKNTASPSTTKIGGGNCAPTT